MRLNDRIKRAVSAALAGAFALGAYQSFTADFHFECDHLVPDGDGGGECVGEYHREEGPDKGTAFFYVLMSGLAFGISVRRSDDDQD